MTKPPAKCFICESISKTEEHHILPREYGGKEDGRTVTICSSCHTAVHALGEHYYKYHEYDSDLYDYLNDNVAAINRLKVIANYVTQAKAMHSAGIQHEAISAIPRNKINVSLTSDELKMLHSVRDGLNLSNIEKTIRYLITNEYMRLRDKKR